MSNDLLPDDPFAIARPDVISEARRLRETEVQTRSVVQSFARTEMHRNLVRAAASEDAHANLLQVLDARLAADAAWAVAHRAILLYQRTEAMARRALVLAQQWEGAGDGE